MKIYYPNIFDREILNELGRWKVIPLRFLYQKINTKRDYSLFCKSIKKLEQEGYLSSIQGNRSIKIVLSQFRCPYKISQKELIHNLYCTEVLSNLLRFKNFKSGNIFQNGNFDISPDAFIYAEKEKQNYTLAVEVELTHKDRVIVLDELKKYTNSKHCDYVLYITNKQSVLHSYQTALCSLGDTVNDKIILASIKEGDQSFNYENAVYFFRKEERKFYELFG